MTPDSESAPRNTLTKRIKKKIVFERYQTQVLPPYVKTPVCLKINIFNFSFHFSFFHFHFCINTFG